MPEANVGVNFSVKGTDQVEAGFRRAGNAAKTFNRDATGASTALKTIAGYAAGFFGAYKLTQFFADITKNAIEADAAIALLQARLQKVGLEYASVKPRIDDFANSMLRLGRSDEETAGAIGSLVTKTHSLDSAIKLTKLASDLAASGIGTYSENVDNLGKILIGRGQRALVAFGVKLQDSATVTEQLASVQQKVTRTTEQWAETTEGQVARMTTSWAELKEGIGNVLLPTVNDAIDALNKLLNIGNEQDSRSDWTKALGLKLEGAFKKTAVALQHVFGMFKSSDKSGKEVIDAASDAIARDFQQIDAEAERSMAAILKGTTKAGGGVEDMGADFEGVVDDLSAGARKLEDSFRDVSKSVADSVDEQAKAIGNLRREMKDLDSDLEEQLGKTKDRQKQELVELARRSQERIAAIDKEIDETTRAEDRGWRTRVEELEREKEKEKSIIARVGGDVLNIKDEIAKDDLMVLQEQHAREIQEIRDQAERKKLELQKEELERQKFILETAVATKGRGFFSTAMQEAGTFLGSIGQASTQQSFVFNFNGDVSDIDTLKKVIIDALNREATLRGVGGK